ncbi:MAG: response regulator [Armatimonadetes bacterium]|nr:response regulator [Armatimonadota bacterium]
MCKILVIDDEEAVRSAVKRRLERDNYEVDTAETQAEGIEAINTHNPPYDVVVTDMVMESPTSGLEVLQTALASDIFTELIVLTAYGNVGNAVECMKRGAFDYVEKNIPGVDVFELLSLKVQQALERRKVSLATLRRIEHFTNKK